METETDTELSPAEYESLIAEYENTLKNLQEGQIIRGRVIQVTPSEVIVDIGYKSEGVISIEEFTDYERHRHRQRRRPDRRPSRSRPKTRTATSSSRATRPRR